MSLQRFLVALLVVGAATISPTFAVPAEDGLYAVFQTTRGEFTAKLEFEKAPVTVANFVGLADGSRTWLDLTTGGLRNQPFYNDVSFHRIIPGFMIQTGSRNGEGTDGPGYMFGDEFHTDLAHNAPGILSMANSGKNSNGSQFFVTLDTAPWLDDVHSVFGRVVEGMEVIAAIGTTGTEDGTPTETTTIESITIVAVGEAASAFQASEIGGLPELRDAQPRLRVDGLEFLIDMPRTAFTRYDFFISSELSSWSYLGFLNDLSDPELLPVDITESASGQSRRFYRVPAATYPAQPAILQGLVFYLQITSGNQTLRFELTEDEGYNPELSFGSYSLNGEAPGNVEGYFFANTLHTLYVDIALENLDAYSFSFHFATQDSGWFSAQPLDFNGNEWPIFGTFHVEPLP